MSTQDSIVWHDWMLRAWQLALLRFAVTLDNADRLHVLAIAREIDRGGDQRDEHTSFSFFRRTSGELCSSLLQRNDAADAILHRFLMSIEDPRLKRSPAHMMRREQV